VKPIFIASIVDLRAGWDIWEIAQAQGSPVFVIMAETEELP
jgi:hypothetical protein